MRAWKPGDVAEWQYSRSDARLALRVSDCPHDHRPGGHWHLSNGGWTQGDDSSIRPLVVIDPEDREQVERIVAAFERARGESMFSADDKHMQAALRSLIAPPKPNEPMGKYAVVIANSVAWCRAAWANDRPWNRMGTSVYSDWADMDVTSIEHEGVQP